MTGAPPVTLPPAGLRATARIRAVADGRGGTALPLLAGEGPLALRRTRGTATEAGVMLVGAMSAPLGGDHLTVEAAAGPGAHLALASAAATLALPGRGGEPARYDVHLTLEDGASVRWLPEPLVSVRGSDLRVRTRVQLAPTAHLVLREEQVLGRWGRTRACCAAGSPPPAAGGRSWTRSSPAAPARPVAGTARPDSPGTGRSANSWSSTPPSPRPRPRRRCWGSSPWPRRW